jgi:hypothetical protein
MHSNTWSELPRPISRIGLGCARLTGGMGMRQSEAVIKAALDAGITHFDTAPSYGFGTSEAALGQILHGEKDTTIATKVGIRAAGNGNLMSAARALIRPFVSRLPGLRARIGKSLAPPKAHTHDNFDIDFVRNSIAQSMQALRRDRLDILLLHEPSSRPEDALIEQLASMQQGGQLSLYGIGTGLELSAPPVIGDVAQHRWSPAKAIGGKRNILHGALRWWLPSFNAVIAEIREEHPGVLDCLNVDLSDDRNLPAALLTFALKDTPSSTFLISSNDPQRISTLANSVDWNFVTSPREDVARAYNTIKSALISKIEANHPHPNSSLGF